MITFLYQHKGNIDVCEDSLTSGVFDLLKYLPTSLFWRILKNSLYQDKLPAKCGELEGISFWEKWDPENTGNTSFVEPDIFLSFNEFDVIIEAKRYDKDQQNRGQWNAQIQAYINEFGAVSKELFYLQLGGLHDLSNDENIKIAHLDVVVCKTGWSKLLDQIIREKSKLEKEDSINSPGHLRILIDLVRSFELHGYYRKNWLSEISNEFYIKNHSLNNFAEYATK